jgi:hypothetical protein
MQIWMPSFSAQMDGPKEEMDGPKEELICARFFEPKATLKK